MARSKRKQRKKKQAGENDWIGSLLLEMVAIIGILFMLFVTSNDRHCLIDLNDSTNQTADLSAAVAGYFSDHLDRHYATERP